MATPTEEGAQSTLGITFCSKKQTFPLCSMLCASQVVQQLGDADRTELVTGTNPEGDRARGNSQHPTHQHGMEGGRQDVNILGSRHGTRASHQACNIGLVLLEGKYHGSVGAGRNTQDPKLGILVGNRE